MDHRVLLLLNVLHILFIFLPVTCILAIHSPLACSLNALDVSITRPVDKHVICAQVLRTVKCCPHTRGLVLTHVHFSLTAILVSHFMLDLHESYQALVHQGSEELSTIQIMSVDIGQPYARDAESEELGDWAVAPNLSSDHTESERWSEESGVSVFIMRSSTAGTKTSPVDDSHV